MAAIVVPVVVLVVVFAAVSLAWKKDDDRP